MNESIQAPVAQGDILGNIIYSLGGKELGSIPIVAAENIERASYMDYMKKIS